MIVTETFTAGQSKEFRELGDFFRLMDTTSVVTVIYYFAGKEVAKAEGVSEGYAERFNAGKFDRVTITSPGAQTIQFVMRNGNIVEYDQPPVGNVSMVSAVPLDLTSAAKRPELPSANWKDVSALVANAPVTVFTAAANTNGAVIWAAESIDNASGAALVQTLIAKATAPASVTDGEILMLAQLQAFTTTDGYAGGRMLVPQRLAAGLGLYFISSQNGAAAGKLRHVRYTLL